MDSTPLDPATWKPRKKAKRVPQGRKVVVWAVVDWMGRVRETTADEDRAKALAPLYDQSVFSYRMAGGKGEPPSGRAVRCEGVLRG